MALLSPQLDLWLVLILALSFCAAFSDQRETLLGRVHVLRKTNALEPEREMGQASEQASELRQREFPDRNRKATGMREKELAVIYADQLTESKASATSLADTWQLLPADIQV